MGYVITRAKEDESDELMHYGVLGMKWGKRKANYNNASTKKSSAQVRADRAKEEAASARKLADKYVNSMDKKTAKRQALADAKAEKKQLIYNDETRRKAAKYVVDQNMTMQDATAKADADAVRNIGVILATLGGITLASLYANSN